MSWSRLCWGALFWFCAVSIVLTVLGCSVTNESSSNEPLPDEPSQTDFSSPPSLYQIALRAEQDAEAGDPNRALREYGNNWFYGQGIGRTMANVGTVVAFPPYALYLLGNAGLALAGYDQVSLTSVLPDPVEEYTDIVYDGITSVPGRITAAIAGEDYRGKPMFSGSSAEKGPIDPPLTDPSRCVAGGEAQNRCNNSQNSAN